MIQYSFMIIIFSILQHCTLSSSKMHAVSTFKHVNAINRKCLVLKLSLMQTIDVAIIIKF